MKKVSIIIPVYNGGNYLRNAIDSALSQTYKNCEIIVVNDGSTDGGETAAIAKSYGNKIRYFEKKNGGVGTAVNLGIAEMTGEYFAWLSHDDMFTPDKIEKQMKAIEASGIERAICHCNFEFLYVEEQKRVKVNWLNQYTKEQLENSCFAPIFLAIHGSTLLIHKSHFERVGNYREDLKATQDSEFLFRAMRGCKSVFVEDSLMVSRIHKEQGQQTMSCHKEEYNEMFLSFCRTLTEKEMESFAGSRENFYYRLYLNLRNAKPADEILYFLKEKLENCVIPKEQLQIIEDWKKSNAQKICIFGAGQMGGELQILLKNYGIEIDSFIDNSEQKWGEKKNGILINSPSYIQNMKDVLVIIGMMDIIPVQHQLEKMNVIHITTIGEIKKIFWNILPLQVEL